MKNVLYFIAYVAIIDAVYNIIKYQDDPYKYINILGIGLVVSYFTNNINILIASALFCALTMDVYEGITNLTVVDNSGKKKEIASINTNNIKINGDDLTMDELTLSKINNKLGLSKYYPYKPTIIELNSEYNKLASEIEKLDKEIAELLLRVDELSKIKVPGKETSSIKDLVNSLVSSNNNNKNAIASLRSSESNFNSLKKEITTNAQEIKKLNKLIQDLSDLNKDLNKKNKDLSKKSKGNINLSSKLFYLIDLIYSSLTQAAFQGYNPEQLESSTFGDNQNKIRLTMKKISKILNPDEQEADVNLDPAIGFGIGYWEN